MPGPRGIREGLCPLEALSQHLALTWSDPLASLASVPSPRKGEQGAALQAAVRGGLRARPWFHGAVVPPSGPDSPSTLSLADSG